MVNWNRFWPFNRKKQENPDVAAEVQEYYQAEQRDRRGTTWLIGAATVVVTILLAALLFFGSRWLYRAVTNDDNGTEAPTTQQDESQDETGGVLDGALDNIPGTTDTPGTGNQGPDTQTTPEQGTTTPNTGSGGSQDLPRSGPDGPESEQ